MSDDEDWFERAVRDLEDGEKDEQDSEPGDSEPDPESSDSELKPGSSDSEPDIEREDSQQDADDASTRTGDGTGPERDPAASPNVSSGEGAAGDDDSRFDGSEFEEITDDEGTDGFAPPWDDEDGEESERSDDGSGGDSLFDDDFGAALDGTDVPDIGGGAGASGDGPGAPGDGFGGDDDGFGSGAGFDGIGDGSEGGFGGGGGGFGGGGGGFGGGGFGGDEEFDDDVDSEIPRIKLGIEGLDAMIQGGVPERSLMTTIGSAGCGKTTFGLQFLNEGLSNGERAVFIALEESRRRVIRSATEKGFPFDEYVEEGRLAIVDIDPVDMSHSLNRIRGELPRLIDDFGASRLVLDSVSLLEMMYENRATRRNEIYDFTQSLKEAGVTTMLTSEASDDNPYVSRHGIVEYLTDAVFVLQYVRPDDFRETRLAIEIQKIRDANHSRAAKPYEITDEGISVYRQANLF